MSAPGNPPLTREARRMWSVLDQLELEENEHVRADLIDEATRLANTDERAARDWRNCRP